MILINICIRLDNNANFLFVEQGVKGWPVLTLKQLFSMAVTFKLGWEIHLEFCGIPQLIRFWTF
jgi:hypothetical protein